MGWPYHFVDLTDQEKRRRRELLDWYGVLAQISVFLPLLFIQVYFGAAWLSRKWQSRHVLEPPSSPRAKHSRSGSPFDLVSLQTACRRLLWWSRDPLDVFGLHLGSKGQVLAAAGWTAWLLLLSSLQTGDDYLHLTKRFGIVAASQLPFHYLMALKSPWSPLQMLTRASHETLNSTHQLLGRVATALIYLHSIQYLNFYVQNNLLAMKLKEAYVLCGIAGVIAFTAVGTTALAPVRQWSYRIFYIVHVVLATALLPILFFHVHHIRIYIYETLIIYAINTILRTLSTTTLPGTIQILPDTNLLELTLPIKPSTKGLPSTYHPGQHAYISLPTHPFLRTFRSNPFTIASLSPTDNHLKFVARILDGNTAKLASNPHKQQNQLLTIEGPYGVATHAEQLLRYDRVLFVAGGVGATFIVPLYRQLLGDLSPGKGSYRRQKVNFLWVARAKAELAWALPEDESEREGFVERLKVCLTRDDTVSSNETAFAVGEDEEDEKVGESEEGIELEERKELLSSHAKTGSNAATKSDLPVHNGRPDLARLVSQTFSHGNGEKVAILVCGPKSLSKTLRQEIEPYLARGRDVWFWNESFSY